MNADSSARFRLRRPLCATLLACALGAVGLGAAAPVQAAVRVCLEDGQGNRLRRVWVQHWFTDYMTNSDGCVSINTTGTIDIRVFAHNPVIRMDDGDNFTLPVSQEVHGVTDGQTRNVPAQGTFWRTAEHFRTAYNNGLREFTPWGAAEFPSAFVREPDINWYIANQGILQSTWPDEGPAVRAWTEGAAVTTGFAFVFNGFPLVHLKQGEEAAHATIAHELGHALHFSRLPNQIRVALEASYGLFLASDPDKVHCFDRRTNNTVAWVEAFGIFAAEYEASAGQGADKQRAFFDRIARKRTELLDGSSCGTPQTGAMFGPDVEGAIVLALFHDFARSPGVGLDFVVESYVSCTSMDFAGYAGCIKDRHGASSGIYRALVAAAGCNGIPIDGAAQAMADAAQPNDQFGKALATGDFNGDGFADIAVGAPGETVGVSTNAGTVNVIYGMPGGLSTQCNVALTENSPGMPGTVAADDRFGEAVATGDFNGDGFTNLAISVPGEVVGNSVKAGHVVVVPGSVHGLDTSASSDWWKDRLGVAGVSAPSDFLGRSLAAGDFNGDGADNLAVGVPGEDIIVFDVGSVLVLYGTPATATTAGGLHPEGSQLLTSSLPGQFDYFGTTLAAGDFDGDGRRDLAVGAPGATVSGQLYAGAVSLFYGGTGGLSQTSARRWTRDAVGVLGAPNASNLFGQSLAFGDFDGDGRQDLAIGAPGAEVAAVVDAGAVAVLYGAASRTVEPRKALWTQDASLVVDVAETGDAFGNSLAATDFDGDGFADLAIGAPLEDVGGVVDAGAVVVLYGAGARFEKGPSPIFGNSTSSLAGGLSGARSQLWSRSSAGVGGDAGVADDFGSSLAVGDFDFDGHPNLAIGAPFDDVNAGAIDAGAVNVLRATSAGIVAAGNQVWTQDR